MTIANRAQHQLRASSHAIAPAGRFNIFVHGVAAQTKDLADLPVAFPLRDQRYAFDLSRAERDVGQCLRCLAQQLAGTIISDRAQQTSGQYLLCAEWLVDRSGSGEDGFGFARGPDRQTVA